MIETSESNDSIDDDDIIIGSKRNNKGDIKDGRKRSSSDNDKNSVNGDLMIDTNQKKRKFIK
jgi:hypothetical protein